MKENIKEIAKCTVVVALGFAVLYVFLLVTAPYGSYESDYKYSQE